METGMKKDKIGFRYAVNGIKSALKSEHNLKIHCGIAVLVLVASYFLLESAVEYIVLFLTIGLVLVAEMVNTAIETIVDLICYDILRDHLNKDIYNERAKIAKDIGAGSVLIAAVIAVIVGLILFIPKILEILQLFD